MIASRLVHPRPAQPAPAPPDDEFYIGYNGNMAPRMRRAVFAAIVSAALVASVVVTTAVVAFATLPSSRFDFGTVTEVSGTLRRLPYPVLDTESGRVWLVGVGKFGADPLLAGLPDGAITVRGSRIQRGARQMFEVREVVRSGGAPIGDDRERDLGPVTLRGEIVDSKCFLGVMNPAEGAVHRDCARRCLSGGIPPMLLVRDGAHREELVVLVWADGRPVPAALRRAAGVPLEVSGRLARNRGDYILYVWRWNASA